ncbi:hypothetical protein [Pseudomonas sp. FP603]
MKNEEERAWNFDDKPQEREFAPAAIRQSSSPTTPQANQI